MYNLLLADEKKGWNRRVEAAKIDMQHCGPLHLEAQIVSNQAK